MSKTNQNRIYTKKGDDGKTRLVGGCLVSKSDSRIEAYGSVDELNSLIGTTRAYLVQQTQLLKTEHELEKIQHELFCLGSLLACEDVNLLEKLPSIPENAVSRIESSIDEMTHQLPTLKEFIIPGGTIESSWLHICRTQCRRSERNSVKLYESSSLDATQKNAILQAVIYLNRLSDYFFTAARFANFCLGQKDSPWVKPKSSDHKETEEQKKGSTN